MTCEEIQEMASAFVDDELEGGAEQILFGHLEMCEECRRFMRSTLRSRSMIIRAPAPPVPRTLDARMARLANPTLQQPASDASYVRKLFRRRFLVPLPAAIGGLALLLVSVGLLITLAVTGQFQSPPRENYIVTFPEIEVQGISSGKTENTR